MSSSSADVDDDQSVLGDNDTLTRHIPLKCNSYAPIWPEPGCVCAEN